MSTKPKYKNGKQLRTIIDFEISPATYFRVSYSDTNIRTVHRSFLASWQYRVLKNFIISGKICEADEISNDKKDVKDCSTCKYGYKTDGMKQYQCKAHSSCVNYSSYWPSKRESGHLNERNKHL